METNRELWNALKIGDRVSVLQFDGSWEHGVIVARDGDDPIFTVRREMGNGEFTFGFPEEFKLF